MTRWRHGFEVVLTTLGRCTVDPTALPVAGVRADDPALGTTLPGDLWLYAIDGWLQWPGPAELTAPVPVAELAFRPDAGLRRRLHAGRSRDGPAGSRGEGRRRARCR